MKKLLSLWIALLAVAGCSRNESDHAPASSGNVVTSDVGKSAEYFRNLYGAPKAESRVDEFTFMLPGYPGVIRLRRPYLVQEFISDQLTIKVLYSAATQQPIWVRYFLPNPWTAERVNAALSSYGSHWKVAQENLGMKFILRDQASAAYQNSAGFLAYKTLAGELIVYAPQLVVDLRAEMEAAKQKKTAVPKF